jgi:hypothetical protein
MGQGVGATIPWLLMIVVLLVRVVASDRQRRARIAATLAVWCLVPVAIIATICANNAPARQRAEALISCVGSSFECSAASLHVEPQLLREERQQLGVLVDPRRARRPPTVTGRRLDAEKDRRVSCLCVLHRGGHPRSAVAGFVHARDAGPSLRI